MGIGKLPWKMPLYSAMKFVAAKRGTPQCSMPSKRFDAAMLLAKAIGTAVNWLTFVSGMPPGALGCLAHQRLIEQVHADRVVPRLVADERVANAVQPEPVAGAAGTRSLEVHELDVVLPIVIADAVHRQVVPEDVPHFGPVFGDEAGTGEVHLDAVLHKGSDVPWTEIAHFVVLGLP